MSDNHSNDRSDFLHPKTLEGKIMRLMAIFVVAISAIFMIIINVQVAFFKNIVTMRENRQISQVQEKYEESMASFTEETLLQTIMWASDKTDDDFWVLEHDFYTLRAQVEDVFRNSENYARVPVSEPDPSKEGEYSLQILFPDKKENVDSATLDIMERLANLAPLMEETVSGNDGYTLDCYIATPDGVTLAMDSRSGGKFDESGNLLSYDARKRPWFKGAVESGEIYFQPVSHSYFYNCNVLAFGIPVYVDDELVAVIEGCAMLESLENKLGQRTVGDDGFSVLISDKGQLVCSTKEYGELKNHTEKDDISVDIRNSVNPEITGVINDALSGNVGVDIVKVDDKRYYAAYAPLLTVNWTEISFVSEEEVLAPSKEMIDAFNQSEKEMLGSISKTFRKTGGLILFIVLIFTFMLFWGVGAEIRKRVEPINHMSKALREFTSHDMEFKTKSMYQTGDEIEQLALSFESMSMKLKEYVNEIVKNTAEKERLKTEMDTASQIQLKMLPKALPDTCANPRYDLFAKMIPAKSVGGDLYDFFFLDDDRLVLTIGDVSGKGITAALFMTLSKQMLKSQMMLNGGDLTAAMREANNGLCEESADYMFVTVWMGVLTLSTGVLEFVNGGHLYAAIKRGDNDFAIETDIHGILLGAIDNTAYELNTTTLQKGDVVYLYTDGITEAQYGDSELFGEERLLEALNEVKDLTVDEIDTHVRKRVDEFVKGKEQYDDMTTLCFKYIGN